MSQEKLFQTTNALDSRIADISPQLHYEVYHSGQESTTYRIKDDSGTSTSQMQFNFNSPGSASVIDRLMLVEATLQFKVNFYLVQPPGTSPPTGLITVLPSGPFIECAVTPHLH